MANKKDESVRENQTAEEINEIDDNMPEKETEAPAEEKSAQELIREAVAESEDKYLRLAAEYANFRSRTVKEREMNEIKCVSETVKNLLPVLDNLEIALKSIENEEDSPVKKGLELIAKGITDAFEKIGVEKIKTENEQFDPNLHEAVMHVDDDTLDENVIAEELRAGYIYKETVVRHSMVKVAN